MTISHNTLTRVRFGMSGISALLFIISVTFVTFKGFNWGLDFTGGIVAEVNIDHDIASSTIKAQLDTELAQDVQLVNSNEPGRWIIRYNQTGTELPVINDVLSPISSNVEILNSSVVGPQVGQDMVEQGSLAILVCFVLTMLYLSYRFEWRLALGSLVALVYDVVLVVGLFSVTQLEFNLTVLAAVLAVLGYSLNDSIIIADRARELLKGNPNGTTNHLINDAVKATFSRTLVTSGTTLVTVASLWLLGGSALEGFAIALVVGIASGTWSSISLGVTLPQLIGLQPQHYVTKMPDNKEAYP